MSLDGCGKSKLVCLSFLILTKLVSVLQEICLYSYRFVLFWLKLGNVSFADTNPCILVTMLFLWEVCLILEKGVGIIVELNYTQHTFLIHT